MAILVFHKVNFTSNNTVVLDDLESNDQTVHYHGDESYSEVTNEDFIR